MATEERDAEQRWWRLIASDEEAQALHSQERKKERKKMREREEGESSSEGEREKGSECKETLKGKDCQLLCTKDFKCTVWGVLEVGFELGTFCCSNLIIF